MNKIPQAADKILRQNHVGVLATVSRRGPRRYTFYTTVSRSLGFRRPNVCIHTTLGSSLT